MTGIPEKVSVRLLVQPALRIVSHNRPQPSHRLPNVELRPSTGSWLAQTPALYTLNQKAKIVFIAVLCSVCSIYYICYIEGILQFRQLCNFLGN
jgi:hypothetical protein